MSSTVAPVTEPLMANRTTQATATPAAICHRFRLRGGSEARAGRRIASPCSLIQHRPLDYVYHRRRDWPGARRARGYLVRPMRIGPRRARVNEFGSSSRHLEITAGAASSG